MIGVATAETVSLKKENSLEGDIEEYGQKNISTVKRNLLNVDEILRIPSTKLLVNLRGNKPLLLDKMIYKNHPLAKKLKESSISEYIPQWTKNINIPTKISEKKEDTKGNQNKKQKIDWDTF